jgi:hypothetical protein
VTPPVLGLDPDGAAGASADEAELLDVVALGEQLVGREHDPLGGEVVVGEALDDRPS